MVKKISKTVICRGCGKSAIRKVTPKTTHFWCGKCLPKYKFYLADTRNIPDPEDADIDPIEDPRVHPIGSVRKPFGSLKGLWD